jgi:hypothetical protein
MRKARLDTERMRSDLSESAFFKQRPQADAQEEAWPADSPPSQPSSQPVVVESGNAQTFKRTDVHRNVRAVVRASFDIFHDQQQALAEIQTARFKETGRKPKMGELAQEAFELYIRTIREQTNE